MTSTLLLILVMVTGRLHAGGGGDHEGYYTENPLYQSRPDLTRERYFGGIGTTGLKARLYPGVVLKVEEMGPRSPSEGKFAKGEILTGINGTALKGLNPFVAMGNALTKAEATDGQMAFDVTSADGKTQRKQTVTIPVLGAYSKTWPLNCPKSKRITEEAAAFYSNDEKFTFGLSMDAALEEPVPPIKAAWGGLTLNTNFRPPSAGPYELPKQTLELWAQYPQGAHGVPPAADREKWHADRLAATGVYYRLMMEHVKKVLSDPKRVYPAYDPEQGFELAGLAWLQGWNDMCDTDTYPNRHQPEGYDEYSRFMACFIRDVRKDLAAPEMPIVIGVIGVGGDQANTETINIRKAMAAPASMPEFKGNVAAVETAPFWASELSAIAHKHEKVQQMRSAIDNKHKDSANADGRMTGEQKNEFLKKFEADLISLAEATMWKRGASNFGFHYLGCAKTFALMGKAFAQANLKMMKKP